MLEFNDDKCYEKIYFDNIDNIKIDSTDQRYILDESYHKVIAEWEHYAVLELFNLESFEATTKEV